MRVCACDSYPARSGGNGRRAREVMPAAMRALDSEPIAVEKDCMR